MLNGKIIKIFKVFTVVVSLSVICGVAYYILSDKEVTEIITEAESNADFKILIPNIDVEKSIVPNVDPRDEGIYKEAFKQGVAHGLGTKFPNEIGNTYLYAHSTRDVKDIDQNAGWFTRLDELTIGDDFEIVYGQNKYTYSITSKEIVDPRATGVYTAYAPVQMVTLQTCHPRGEIEERLVIKALLLNSEPIESNTKAETSIKKFSQDFCSNAHHHYLYPPVQQKQKRG